MRASSDRAAIIAFTAGLHRTAIYRTAIVAFTSGLVISPLVTLTRRWWTLVSKRLSSAQLPPSAKDFAGIDCLVFDCDGVLYCGKSAVPGGPAALTALRQAGKQLLFVTNAAAVSRAGLAAKLTKMGYVGIEAEHCVTSASAAALHLHTTRPDVKTAYVIGGGGLVEELSNVGIASVGPGTSAETDRNRGLEDMVREGWSVARDGAAIGAVVCGALSDGLGYACLGKAAAYARDPRRAFVATNPDANYPGGFDELLPAGGAVATYVGYAAERPPDVWVGKPSRDLAQLLVREHGLTPARTLMVGDRTNTDIAFGRSVGMRTCLVLSGCHTRADAAAAPPEATPEFVAESVADFAC